MSDKKNKKAVLNINIGLLGHVDSGKTSLAKALSTQASTAAFDKHPESRRRGITVDLGFSALVVPVPEHLSDSGYDEVQFTFVDCPGHASLIRTIIGGAQITDTMLLVIDATRGIQTQTAECLVVGEITCDDLVVVINKIDLLPADKREASLKKLKSRLSKTFERTKFRSPPMVEVAASGTDSELSQASISRFVKFLTKRAQVPKRDPSGDLLFAVDHCFLVKGKGTVATGTVLSGTLRVNDEVELAAQGLTRTVKSIQRFRVAVQEASQGDRVGALIANLSADTMERGLICTPKSVQRVRTVVAKVTRIRFFKQAVESKTKFHISLGHLTLMARATFFSCERDGAATSESDTSLFDPNGNYLYQDELVADSKALEDNVEQFVILLFDELVPMPRDSLILASRFDTDVESKSCRLAFSGKVVKQYASADEPFETLRLFKCKRRLGRIDRVQDDHTIIGKDMFSKFSDVTSFLNLRVVHTASGAEGRLEGLFGKSGKFKVYFPNGRMKELTDAPNARELALDFRVFAFGDEARRRQLVQL